MTHIKNILFNTTNSYSINIDIIDNIINSINPEYSCIIVEGKEDLIVKESNNKLIDLKNNKKVDIIERTPFMQETVSDEILNACKPIDYDILQKMSKYEAVIFSQLQRVDYRFRNFYVMYDRYLSILKFWNNFLEEKNIDLFIANNVPHEGFDYIIACLCKIKGIKTLFSYQSPITSQVYLLENIEDGCHGLRETLSNYNQTLKDVDESEILLDDNCTALVERYFTKQDTTPFYMKKQKRNIKYFTNKAIYTMKKTFKNIVKGVFIKNLKFKICRNSKINGPYKKIKKFYNKLAINDLRINGEIEKFIYLPLHVQPECTSNPLGDRFENQEFMIQMISAALPEGYYLYVKEHPKQESNIYRSKEFFARINNLKNVRLVGTGIKTEMLMEHCVATATITGTAAWESLFSLKPVLLFGNFCYQECKGVFKIKTNKELKEAINKIVAGNCFSKKDVLIFVKALSENSVYGYVDEAYKDLSIVSYDDAVKNISNKFIEIIDKY